MQNDRTDRIREMETCLSASAEAVGRLSEALSAYEDSLERLKKLSDYYESALWMDDFEADEAGELPPPEELPRGVLSEDAVYDLLTENRGLSVRMLRLLTYLAENDLG